QEWNHTMCSGARAALSVLGYDCIGADVPVVDDATIGATIARTRQSYCYVLVVVQLSLGNGQLSMAVMQQWGMTVVVGATTVRQESEKASSCSPVAVHLSASIFRLSKNPFEIVRGSPSDDHARSGMAPAILLCQARHRLQQAKLGAIG